MKKFTSSIIAVLAVIVIVGTVSFSSMAFEGFDNEIQTVSFVTNCGCYCGGTCTDYATGTDYATETDCGTGTDCGTKTDCGFFARIINFFRWLFSLIGLS